MSTLELLIAFAIFTLTTSVVTILALSNQTLGLDAVLSREAFMMGEASIHELRFSATEAWRNVSTSPEIFEGIFQKKIDVVDMSPCLKYASSSVGWINGQRHLTTTLGTLLFDATAIPRFGQDCLAFSSSHGWSEPESRATADIVPSLSKATDVDVLGGLAYLAANPSAATSDDLFIFDARMVQNGTPPTLLKSLNTGPGIAALDVAGTFAYAATVSRNAQLQIIDVHDPANPVLRSSYKLPGVYTDATIGTSIFYYDSRLYLGTTKSQISEFHIIDVANPDSPVELGSWEVNAGINSIYVDEPFAYIATPNNEELTVLDVSNPTSITRVGGFDAPLGSGNGKSLYGIGTRLYLGRTVGGTEFYVLDISDPHTPQVLGSFNLDASITDMRVSGQYAFLATSDAKRLQILDVGDPAHMSLVGAFVYSEKPTSIDLEDNQIYLSNETFPALRIIGVGE